MSAVWWYNNWWAVKLTAIYLDKILRVKIKVVQKEEEEKSNQVKFEYFVNRKATKKQCERLVFKICNLFKTFSFSDLLNLPKFFGKIDGLTKMDADFFDINSIQANYMDPQLRILHEVVYETIWDAGKC